MGNETQREVSQEERQEMVTFLQELRRDLDGTMKKLATMQQHPAAKMYGGNGRHLSILNTKLEEARLFAGAALAPFDDITGYKQTDKWCEGGQCC